MNTDPQSIGPARTQPSTPHGGALYIIGFVLASMVTMVALAWAIENWRGARAWSAIKRDLVARGEPLKFDQLVPSMPAEEQNFASTPLLSGLFDYGRTGAGGGQSQWRSPQGLARLSAIALPPTRDLPPGRAPDHRRTRSQSDGRVDLMPYALGIRMQRRNCPDNLDPALAERYGYLPPHVKWHKPTNETEIVASIQDPAREVLEYLQRFGPELQEIEEAVRRPHSQFAIHYSEGYNALLPHLAPLKQFDIIFMVRSAARLRTGDTNGAFNDAMTCLRLAKTVRSEPLLISQLVAFAQHSISVKSVWQGLAAHQWTAEQLAAFQSEFAGFEFQKQALMAVRGERAGQNEFLDQFSDLGASALDALTPEEPRDGAMLLAVPWVPGWVRQNQARLNRYEDLELRQVSNPHWPASLIDGPDTTAAREAAGLTKKNPYTVVARLLAPDLKKVQFKAALAEALNHLAMTACALERFRLAHSSYPTDLSELKPFAQPGSFQDPMSGAPLRYEPDHSTSAGFQLRSVGLNGQDNGGLMQDRASEAQGDWVWPQLGIPGPALF